MMRVSSSIFWSRKTVTRNGRECPHRSNSSMKKKSLQEVKKKKKSSLSLFESWCVSLVLMDIYG